MTSGRRAEPVRWDDPHDLLASTRTELLELGRDVAGRYRRSGTDELTRLLIGVEELATAVEVLQVLLVQALEDRTPPADTLTGSGGPGPDSGSASGFAFGEVCGAGPRHRDHADFLRAVLRISRSEANRRRRLARTLFPQVSPTGAEVPAVLETLDAAFSVGRISSRAATLICKASDRVETHAGPAQIQAMEHHLTDQAIASDQDILQVVARRWQDCLDQDGQEPSEKVLTAYQGVFLRGRRHGLHHLEVNATDDQYEALLTTMTTATNPRTMHPDAGADASAGAADPLHASAGGADHPAEDQPTRAQTLLHGLVSACTIALSADRLPATGGHRPQVMVTIDYRDLLGDVARAAATGPPDATAATSGRPGQAVFAQRIPARSIRQIACDADLIPLVLGAHGQILDIGRAQRLFPPHLRRALIARDGGCAFPDCTIPATWCQAHHIRPWSIGGTTTVDNGVLLCAHHHRLVHTSDWSIHTRHGTPWFTPPHPRGPDGHHPRDGYRRQPRQNSYRRIHRAVHELAVTHDVTPLHD